MNSTNCQTTMPKVLPNQPLFCPWTSTAPLASLSVRHGPKPFQQQANGENLEQASVNCQHTRVNQSCTNNHQMSVNGFLNMTKPTALRYPSIQQSSSQFFHFLRLMQLFPDVHPATLHTVLILCKSDFFCAVDKVLYAKRCKELYNSRRNMMQKSTTSKFSRHQPYCYTGTTIMNNGRHDSEQASPAANDEMQNSLLLQGLVSQMGPLDASVRKIQTQTPAVKSGIKENESILKAKLLEPRKILPRTRLRGRDKLPVSAVSTDLSSVASIHCKLPIQPLSPISGLPEDLSNQSTASENTC